MTALTPPACPHCRHAEKPGETFIARGAVWCTTCDLQTPETLSLRGDVTTTRTKFGRE